MPEVDSAAQTRAASALNYGKTSPDPLAHRKLYPHLGESHGATDAAAEHCFVRRHGSFSAPVMP